MIYMIKDFIKSYLTDPDSYDTNTFLNELKHQTEVIMKNKDSVKFQYLRTYKDKLCLTIGTEIIQSKETTHVFWSVAFKNPKDKFNKQIAREVVMDNFSKMDFVSGELIFDKFQYTRNEIVMKIMMSLHINEVYMSSDYRKLVSDYIYTYL